LDRHLFGNPNGFLIANSPIHAAMRADAMLEKGDLDGYAVWKRILRAVGELRRVEPGDGERVN